MPPSYTPSAFRLVFFSKAFPTSLALFLAFFLPLFASKAQSRSMREEMDSLAETLQKNYLDTVLFKNSIFLAQRYISLQTDSALYYVQVAEKHAQKVKNPLYFAEIAIVRGSAYDRLGNAPAALKEAFNALKIGDSLQNESILARAYNLLGILHKGQDEYETAKNYWLKAYQIRLKQKEPRATAIVSNNLGAAYDLLEKYDSAVYFYNQSIALKLQQKDSIGAALSRTNIGVIFKKQTQYDSAKYHIETALRSVIDKENLHVIAICYLILGDIAEEEKEYDKMQFYGKKIYEIAQKAHMLDFLANSTRLLARSYAAKGNKNLAYDYLEQYIRYKDSLRNDENLKKIENIKYQYKLQQKDEENKRLQKETELQEVQIALAQAQIERRDAILWGLFFVGLAIILTAYLLYQNGQKQRKISKKLKEKNEALAQSQEDLKQVNEELNTTLQTVQNQKSDIEEKNKAITDSINYAQRIQEAILPEKAEIEAFLRPSFAPLSDFTQNSFVFYQPRDIVSGDFYFFQPLGEKNKSEKAILATADCTGHGVSGALMSMIGNELLTQIVIRNQIENPDEILNTLHQEIRRVLKQKQSKTYDGMDISVVKIDKKERTLSFAGAKTKLVSVFNGDLSVLKGDKMEIGGEQRESERVFSLQKLPFPHAIQQDGKTTFQIYLFSDGFQDQFGGEEGKKLGFSNFKRLLLQLSALPIEKQEEEIAHFFQTWKDTIGSPEAQVDDVMVLGLDLSKI
ncbi:tetratricopeptide repeat protein [Hugenholtzia roseola]|uniref:tetratricopeptide repeat protein n=1 Tax=Hugenholtzia roseola TaxID=1002 RepID=UPI0004189500|nr:tetratricopeptide repeat protein [Hugenholtzia roseola]